MLMLSDEYPKCCPNCGEVHSTKYENLSDFFAGASCTCLGCNASYAYAPTAALVELGAAHGDLGRYVGPDGNNL